MIVSPLVDRLVALALDEDLALGDPTTDATIAEDARGIGRIVAKAPLVVAGIDVARRVFTAVDPRLQLAFEVRDGDVVSAGTLIGTVTGSTRALLRAERPALNFLQRLCGIATSTRQYVNAVAGTNARVVDTRKTTPGWRVLEKAAVRAGGGHNHRLSLGSGILIKDNHVDSAGGVGAAVRAARRDAPHLLGIEVEVRTLDELREAIDAGAHIVLLDNMSLEQLRIAAATARSAGVLTEASGGVRLETIASVAATGVDLISVGALTHSAIAVDIHMKVAPVPAPA